jgi:hypothetical protein
MIDLTVHQGGILNGKLTRPVATLPTYLNTIGGKSEYIPPGVTVPNVRRLEAPDEICLRKWIREIIERNDGPEVMLTTAMKRVTEHHSEERLLEAQAVLNELGRTGEHAALLTKHVGPEHIKSLLRKGK